jgi:hypothetical protein
LLSSFQNDLSEQTYVHLYLTTNNEKIIISFANDHTGG